MSKNARFSKLYKKVTVWKPTLSTAPEGREFASGYTNRAKGHGRAEKKPAPNTSAMQHELTYLRQQVEFLKKLPSWTGGQSGGADNGQARQEVRTDITYIPYHGVDSYLATTLDAYTKQVLAYILSPDSVLEMVHSLIQKHGVSIDAQTLVHSDQGCHYTSLRFIQFLKDSSLRQSISRRGNCWDNAPQESFFGHMKDEIDLSEKSTAFRRFALTLSSPLKILTSRFILPPVRAPGPS